MINLMTINHKLAQNSHDGDFFEIGNLKIEVLHTKNWT